MATISAHTNFVQNTTPHTSNAMYKGNSVAANKNSFERTPNSDVIVKTKQDNTKTILSLGALATTGIGIVYAIKKAQVKNINNIQKAFQDVFLRDDISIEETKAMLKRYKEIEKIKDKKEYTKALFEEAKKNYRMDDTNYKLAFDLPCKGAKNYYGFCSYNDETISISSKCPRSHLLNTMHHEFRHSIQHRIAKQSDEALKIRCLVDLQYDEDIKRIGDNEVELKKLQNYDYVELLLKKAKEKLKKYGFVKTAENTKRLDFYKKNNEKPFSVPEKYSEWKDKCIEAEFYSQYCSPDNNYIKYFKQFVEKDARQAGGKMEKFVKGEAFSIRLADVFDLLICLA